MEATAQKPWECNIFLETLSSIEAEIVKKAAEDLYHRIHWAFPQRPFQAEKFSFQAIKEEHFGSGCLGLERFDPLGELSFSTAEEFTGYAATFQYRDKEYTLFTRSGEGFVCNQLDVAEYPEQQLQQALTYISVDQARSVSPVEVDLEAAFQDFSHPLSIWECNKDIDKYLHQVQGRQQLFIIRLQNKKYIFCSNEAGVLRFYSIRQ